MARCHICNTRLIEVELDDNGKIEPCDHCMEAIRDVTSEDEVSDLFIELGYTLNHDDDL